MQHAHGDGRFFKLKFNMLQYYKLETDAIPIDSIALPDDVTITELPVVDGKAGFELKLEHRDYYLWAATLEEKKKWIAALCPLNEQ